MTIPKQEQNISPPTTIYNDNWLDRSFIYLFSSKIAKALGIKKVPRGYEGFVSLSRAVMQGRNSSEQRAVIAIVLQSIIPNFVLVIIRNLFTPNQTVCELNAWFASLLFEWLVGSLSVKEVEVNGKRQKSGVQIKKCRYLEQSGCAAMCINLCKVPTQDFFTQQFGIPLTMTPNFEDFSCEMVFGQVPLPPDRDPAFGQGCLSLTCSTAINHAPCPKI
ncbi:MAG: DUF4033 domain-containing protein [Cyanobacteria bacterium M5B4]|nr:MAG: DUF4033 domain-containing protein [Cyanobacteria bacterium M5B4]